MRTKTACLTALLLLSCDDSPREVAVADDLVLAPIEHEAEPDDPMYWSSTPRDPLAAIDCAEHTDTGYVKGDPFTITVVTVDGKPVEVDTANAFYQMAQAAAKAGVTIKVVSGFRTMDEQKYLYNCYINCNCNNCNEAAKPGYSNHQSGHALDLNTGGAGVLNWLNAHGNTYGFSRTVPSEDWHWEWWGGGPPASGPCGVPEFRAEYAAQSFPLASKPPVLIEVGAGLDAWIDLKNTGKATWTSNTRLAPTPRDVASPLADPTWMSPTRIASPQADTPPGKVGRFAFRLAGTVAGDYSQTFGLVEEGVTWFADKPKGGGPPDTQLEVHVLVIDPAPPLPPPPDPTTGAADDTGAAAGSSSGSSAGQGSDGDADAGSGDEPTGPEGHGSGDMSSGTSASGTGTSGAGADSGAGAQDDAGCGCRGSGRGGEGLAWALGLGLWAARRRRDRG